MKFRKKSIVIEAIHFIGTNGDKIAEFMQLPISNHKHGLLKIGTLDGVLTVTIGDWVVKGVKGEFYVCKPHIFDATYEQVSE